MSVRTHKIVGAIIILALIAVLMLLGGCASLQVALPVQ